MLLRRAFMLRTPFRAKLLTPGSRKQAIAELDKPTSIIVRKRDRKCVTCGATQGLQCSHYHSRRYLSIRFNLINCNAQCAKCNRLHNLNPVPYLKYMESAFGLEALAQLDQLRISRGKVEDSELIKLMEEYRKTA